MSWTWRDRKHERQWNKCSTDRSELRLWQTLVKNQRSLITSTSTQTFTPASLRTLCSTSPKLGFTCLTISRSCHIMSRYGKQEPHFWVVIDGFYLSALVLRSLTETKLILSGGFKPFQNLRIGFNPCKTRRRSMKNRLRKKRLGFPSGRGHSKKVC